MLQTRSGADLFNVNWFKSASKTKPVLVQEFMLANDTAFITHSHQDMLDIITCFATTAKAYRLQINLNNIKVMLHPSPGIDSNRQNMQIEGMDLARVENSNSSDPQSPTTTN